MPLRRMLAGLLALVVGITGCAAWRTLHDRPQKPRKDDCCDPERAGNPDLISPHAHPSDTGNYVGYRVGGGAARGGDGPCPEEGTWGWDYEGCLIPSRIMLDWFHGRKYQDGMGAYKTEGPRPRERLRECKEE